ASTAVPALPGATKTFSTRLSCATFQARACSRPPLPMISTFMGVLLTVARMQSGAFEWGVPGFHPGYDANLSGRYKNLATRCQVAMKPVDARRPRLRQAQLPNGNEHWRNLGQQRRCRFQ